MELKELISKWDEEIAMHRRVIENPLMWTKEDRIKSSHQTQAICALMADVKKLSIPPVVVLDGTLYDVCGSDDVIEAPSMGRNCNSCNPI